MSNHHHPHKQRVGRWSPRRRAAALTISVITAATVILAVLPGTAAYAGDWMQVSCVNPNQTEAASQGWTSFAAGGGSGSNNITSCGPGSPMFAMLSSDAAVPVGSDETLKYAPPKGSELTGGSLDVSLYGDGYGTDASGTAVAYTPEFEYDGSNVFFQCAFGQPACSPGGNDYSGELSIPSGRGGDVYLSAGCGGTGGQACDAGGVEGAWSLVRLWWANLLLANDSTPAATPIAGTLLNPAARGTQELTFTATDPEGPGVYTVTAQIDGQTVYSATPNTNAGQCAPVGESDGALMFDSSQPCPASESVDLPIDTTGLADGQHTLKVTIEDAARNTSIVYDSTITTHNAPTSTTGPAVTTPAQLTVDSTLNTTPGEWTAPAGAGSITYSYQWEDCDGQHANCQAIPGAQKPTYTLAPGDAGHTLRLAVTAADNDGATIATSAATGAVLAPESVVSGLPGPGTGSSASLGSSTDGSGTPNGVPASEIAILQLHGAPKNPVPFAKRAFKLTGQLTDNQSRPITGATLDVLQQTQGSNTLTLIKHAQTSATGTFSVSVPAGPSRLIEIAYRAHSNDSSYTATATIQETVQAGARLKISWLKTPSPTGTIIFTGKVQGPTPHQGTLVQILVNWHGHWELIRNPRTNNNGYFHAEYQFQGSIGRFPFLAEIPTGQTNFPYSRGYSNTVSVSTG